MAQSEKETRRKALLMRVGERDGERDEEPRGREGGREVHIACRLRRSSEEVSHAHHVLAGESHWLNVGVRYGIEGREVWDHVRALEPDVRPLVPHLRARKERNHREKVSGSLGIETF